MRLINTPEHLDTGGRSLVCTVGNYDGLHSGHRAIMQRLVETARTRGWYAAVVSFWPHPVRVLHDAHFRCLSTRAEKESQLAEVGVDYLINLTFTRAFSTLSAKEFIEEILLKKLPTRAIVLGENHRLGHDRVLAHELLARHQQRWQIEVHKVPGVRIAGLAVSSSLIRSYLSCGDVAMAGHFLGRSFSLEGRVISGKQIGRQIGFPTANLQLSDITKFLPKIGVYAVEVVGPFGRRGGMLHIGRKKNTADKQNSIEVHIFDLDEDLYGSVLTIFFITFLRENRFFGSLSQLREQLTKDRRCALFFLAERGIVQEDEQKNS